MDMRALVRDLEARRARVREMGGPEKVARQHERGKLTARERMALLFDGGDFVEIGLHGTQMAVEESGSTPADGVICGWGRVGGRMACGAAYDFTVKGGSIGQTGEVKVTRMRELALRERVPMVWLVDSAGARIDPGAARHPDMISLFADSGYLFKEQVIMSGVVPQVAAMVGPGAAGTAYIPGLADFVPMVKDIGSMALGGPPLVKAVTGEDVTEQDLGGSRVHCERSGCGDMELPDDRACIEAVRTYLSYFPSHCREKPPVVACDDPVDRREEALLDVLPENPRQGYDVHDVIGAIVDGGAFFELKPRWARNMVIGLARFGGRPAGIVANNPKRAGGVLDVDAADKAARFMLLCDAFNVPLVFLQDVPGFMVGTKVEEQGIIRHGARMLHAMAQATVPKVCVVLRKAYGAGYYVMNGRAFDPDLFVTWPTGEISVMGAEGMLGILSRRVGAMEMDEGTREQVLGVIRQHINPYKAAGWGFVDDVIDPRDTRRVVCLGLELSWNKTVERPWRKHGVMPG
jgi:acetyl-CoA carboxylase carboxyltransferase component